MVSKTYRLESFGISEIGLVREHNEDAWAAYPEEGLFILADGMGGHLAGEVAAHEAIEHLHQLSQSWLADQKCHDPEKFFREAFLQVNTWVYEKGQEDDTLHGMGTTLCSLCFCGPTAVVAHIGDSRLYRLRGKHLEQLTEDHSLVSELVALGAMPKSEAETFPYKHILTRAVGTHSKVEPTVHTLAVEPFDLYLLCSDGLTNYISHEQIEEVLLSPASLAKMAESLVSLALEQGGGDNITLILIQPCV